MVQQLQRLGALVKPVEPLMANDDGHYRDSLTKLRVFELEEYEKVCGVAADTLGTGRRAALLRWPPQLRLECLNAAPQAIPRPHGGHHIQLVAVRGGEHYELLKHCYPAAHRSSSLTRMAWP